MLLTVKFKSFDATWQEKAFAQEFLLFMSEKFVLICIASYWFTHASISNSDGHLSAHFVMPAYTYPIAESRKIEKQELLHSRNNCVAVCSTSFFTGTLNLTCIWEKQLRSQTLKWWCFWYLDDSQKVRVLSSGARHKYFAFSLWFKMLK